jgi:hypothetical protein
MAEGREARQTLAWRSRRSRSASSYAAKGPPRSMSTLAGGALPLTLPVAAVPQRDHSSLILARSPLGWHNRLAAISAVVTGWSRARVNVSSKLANAVVPLPPRRLPANPLLLCDDAPRRRRAAATTSTKDAAIPAVRH